MTPRRPPASAAQGFLVTASFLGVLLLVTFWASLPAAVTPGWLRAQSSFPVLWPQGWYFYAHVSRESTPVLFRIGPDGTLTRRTKSQADPDYWYGIRRSGAADMVESNELHAAVPADRWTPCGPAPGDCRGTATIPIRNGSAHPRFCGHYLIVMQAPARRHGPPARIERAADVEIRCD